MSRFVKLDAVLGPAALPPGGFPRAKPQTMRTAASAAIPTREASIRWRPGPSARAAVTPAE